MSSLLQVFAPTDATTCGATDISWTYGGVNGLLSLNVTNAGVPQRDPIPPIDNPTGTPAITARAEPTTSPSPFITIVLSTTVSSDGPPFLWEPVALPPGWYKIQASIPDQGVSEDSGRFFVKSSTDTSCLTAATPSTTAGASSTTGTSNSISATVTLITTPNSSGTAVPVGGAASGSSGLSKGAIAGIALGAIALVFGWLAAWWFFFRKSKRSPLKRPESGGGKPLGGHRSALASMDSTSGLMGKPFGSRQPSTGTIPLSPLDDEKGSMHSGRKYSGSSAMALGLPPLDFSQGSRRPSRAESAYGRQSMDSAAYPPTLSGMNPPGSSMLERSPSINSSTTYQPAAFNNQGGGLYLNSTTSSAAPSPSPYSTRGDPDSPSDYTPNQARRGSVSNNLNNKKRKPVPAYDPGAEEPTPVSPSATPIPPASSSPSPSPVPPSSSTPPPMSHYTTRNRSQPELTHKSSFGPGGVEGKPLHYLIPDMPLASKD